MWKYKYVKGKEIKTYQDIVDSYHGFIILDETGEYNYDRLLLLTKDEQTSIKRLNDILEQGSKVYSRVKEYRQPVFSNEIDEELETILTDFAYDSQDTYPSDYDILDNTLKKLKELLKDKKW